MGETSTFKHLQDDDAHARLSLLVTLIQKGDKGLYEQILSGLQSPHKEVVIGAALVLAKLKDNQAFWSLIQAFKTHQTDIGAAVAYALGELGDKRAIPWLRAAIEHDFVTPSACEAMGKIGDLDGLPTLLNQMTHTATNVRALSARALGMLSYQDNSQALQDALWALKSRLKDPVRKVRLCAALSLHHLGYLP